MNLFGFKVKLERAPSRARRIAELEKKAAWLEWKLEGHLEKYEKTLEELEELKKKAAALEELTRPTVSRMIQDGELPVSFEQKLSEWLFGAPEKGEEGK